MLGVHGAEPDLGGAVGTHALAQFEGLVAPDVHRRTRHALELFEDQGPGECGVVLGGCEHGRGKSESGDDLQAVGAFRTGPVVGMGEPASEMAEGVLVDDQLDADRAADAVEPGQIVGRDRRCVLPHDTVTPEREGVFDVELELVVATGGEPVDEAAERGAGRNPVAGDVQHVAPGGEVGPVGDVHRGQGPVGSTQLCDGRFAVTSAGRVRPGESRAVPVDGQGVPLRGQGRIPEGPEGRVDVDRCIVAVEVSGPGKQLGG